MNELGWAEIDSPTVRNTEHMPAECTRRLNVVPTVFSAYSARRKGAFMAKDEVYIERREQGGYAVRRPGSERASAILPTQAQAIERAREMNPDAAVHVERVRDTNVGGRDKWRKP